jgi:hypothetical protein
MIKKPVSPAVEKPGSCGIPCRRLGLAIIQVVDLSTIRTSVAKRAKAPRDNSIDCTEPQNLTLLSPHASHPFSGVLPRKIR